MTSRKTTIPPLLHPYLSLPPSSSLLLLTGVLNASTHWLSVRVLRGALGDPSSLRRKGEQKEERNGQQEEERNEGQEREEDVAVVLVSWQRDFEFWKTEARRGAGLDLARLAQEDRFAFVDGLTHLLSPPPPTPTPTVAPAQTLPPRQHPAIPIRNTGGPLPLRPAPQATTPTTTPQKVSPSQSKSTTTTTTTTTTTQSKKNQHTLTTPHLPHALDKITTAIRALTTTNPTKRILLVLDSPSTPLALTSTPSATPLTTLLLHLRTLVSTTVVALETDLPFLQPSVHALTQSSLDTTEGRGDVRVQGPLETEMSRLLVGLAHQARWVVSVRGLDTGVARDVSGVVRCSRGGGWDDDYDEEEEDTKQGHVKETAENEIEVLYFVQGDGGVKVFERGGGEIG